MESVSIDGTYVHPDGHARVVREGVVYFPNGLKCRLQGLLDSNWTRVSDSSAFV